MSGFCPVIFFYGYVSVSALLRRFECISCRIQSFLLAVYNLYVPHQNISHLFFNMVGLLIFGLSLERAIGSKEFLLFYLITGTLSGVFSFLVFKFTGQYRVFLIGASGAIYAVLFAYAVFFPRSIIYIWGIIPLPAPLMVVLYAIIELGSQFFSSDNVAHLTHLFGFLSAWLYFVIRMGIHPVKVWKNTYRK